MREGGGGPEGESSNRRGGDGVGMREGKGKEKEKDKRSGFVRKKKRRLIVSDSESEGCLPSRDVGRGESAVGGGDGRGVLKRSVAVVGGEGRSGGGVDGWWEAGGEVFDELRVGMIGRKVDAAREEFGGGEHGGVSVKRTKTGVLKVRVGKVMEGGDGGRESRNSSWSWSGESGGKGAMDVAAKRHCGVADERSGLGERAVSRVNGLLKEGSSRFVGRDREARESSGVSKNGDVIRVQGRGGLLKDLPGSKKTGGFDSRKPAFKKEGDDGRMESVAGRSSMNDRWDHRLGGKNGRKDFVSNVRNAVSDKRSLFSGDRHYGKSSMPGISGSVISRWDPWEENDRMISASGASKRNVDVEDRFSREVRTYGRTVLSGKTDNSNKYRKELPGVIRDREVLFSGEKNDSKNYLRAAKAHNQGYFLGAKRLHSKSGPSYKTDERHKYQKKYSTMVRDKQDIFPRRRNSGKDHMGGCADATVDDHDHLLGDIRTSDVSGPSHKADKDRKYKKKSSSVIVDSKDCMTGCAGAVVDQNRLPRDIRTNDISGPFYNADKGHKYKKKSSSMIVDKEDYFAGGKKDGKDHMTGYADAIVDGRDHVSSEIRVCDGSGSTYKADNDTKYHKKDSSMVVVKQVLSGERNTNKGRIAGFNNAVVDKQERFSGEFWTCDGLGSSSKADEDRRFRKKYSSKVHGKRDHLSQEKDNKYHLDGFATADVRKEDHSSGESRPHGISESSNKERKIYKHQEKHPSSLSSEKKDVAHVPPKKKETKNADHVVEKVQNNSASKPSEVVNKSVGLQKTDRGTEKQKLREEIKNMLLEAGWKIELRPRRNRDYKDSVYVSPQGTGYWSITKAYAVYMEQLKESNEAGTSNIEGAAENKSNASTVDNENSPIAAAFLDKISILKRTVANKRNSVGKKGKSSECCPSSRIKDTSGKKKKNRRGCTLLARTSECAPNFGTDEYRPYLGKRTVLAWMIDIGILPVNGKVKYMNEKRTQTLLEGWITREGIHCSCCSKMFSISDFDRHAGSELQQPYENIFLEESGSSLLECQLSAWDKQEKSESCEFYFVDCSGDDPNDDTCGICGDGGDLMCCDSCPLTFHLTCLDMETLPSGEWHCSNCSCKFCGEVDHFINCGSASSSELLSCKQCEEKYHRGCLAEEKTTTFESSTTGSSFCGSSCKKIFEQIQKLLGIKNELEAGFSWSLVQRIGVRSQSSVGTVQRAECNSKVAVAVQIMDECFLPLVDQRSGVNLIHNIVYNSGSNFNRLSFTGFYTFILERGDEIVAAASVRIHGTRLAEMPFIGTRGMHRRQGMCRRLLNAIEHVLCSLNIEKLVIPAISELIQTWTTVFDFKHLEGSLKQEIKSINMLVFPGTGLLEKTLLKKEDVTWTGDIQSNINVTPRSSGSTLERLQSTDLVFGDKAKVENKGCVDSFEKCMIDLSCHHVYETGSAVGDAVGCSHSAVPGQDISDVSKVTEVIDFPPPSEPINHEDIPSVKSGELERKSSRTSEVEDKCALSESVIPDSGNIEYNNGTTAEDAVAQNLGSFSQTALLNPMVNEAHATHVDHCSRPCCSNDSLEATCGVVSSSTNPGENSEPYSPDTIENAKHVMLKGSEVLV